MSCGNKFIITSDIETRDTLIKLGYQLVQTTSDGVCLFINNCKIAMSDNIDKNKVYYSNVLCV